MFISICYSNCKKNSVQKSCVICGIVYLYISSKSISIPYSYAKRVSSKKCFILQPNSNLWCWKGKPKRKCQNWRFFKQPFEADSKSQPIPMETHIRTSHFKAEINFLQKTVSAANIHMNDNCTEGVVSFIQRLKDGHNWGHVLFECRCRSPSPASTGTASPPPTGHRFAHFL